VIPFFFFGLRIRGPEAGREIMQRSRVNLAQLLPLKKAHNGPKAANEAYWPAIGAALQQIGGCDRSICERYEYLSDQAAGLCGASTETGA
jgi:hypothetical protein